MRPVPLLDVAEHVARAPSPFDGARSYYATADVVGSEFLEGTLVTFRDRPTRANLVGDPGDLLFAKMQATDKTLQLDGDSADAIFSTGFFNLKSRRKKLDSRYLYWFLRSPIFQDAKDRRCTGATQKALTLTGLREIDIPLADGIKEQRRIAAILDKADGIRRKREHMLAIMNDLVKSAFHANFGDPVSNPKDLPTAPIKEFGKVVTGNTPPRKDSENYGSAIEWIKSDNINTPSHRLTKAEECLSEIGKQIGRIAPAGTTLITCIAGSPGVIWNAALADREVAFNQQINAVIPNEKTDPFFLYCQFLVGKKLVQAASTNSMKGMVSKGKFQEVSFLKPDVDCQKAFGRYFGRTIKILNKLRAAHLSSQELFNSLCGRAFRGEL